MALCGAGCMGFVNNASGVRALGYLEPHPLPTGGISVVTHSGSAFSTLLRSRRGFGFRLAVSSGQELVTDTADYVGHALDDPQTRVIGLLMETPRRSARLAEALHRAADQGVPVIILTVGGSPRGRSMVAAHSGALAGDAAGWAAFCAATGAVRTTDMSEFTDTLELFGAGRRSQASLLPDTGLLSPPAAGAAGYAEKLLLLAGDEAFRRAAGAAALKKAEEFRWPVILEGLIGQYRQAMATRTAKINGFSA